jgi:hypothetical protein
MNAAIIQIKRASIQDHPASMVQNAGALLFCLKTPLKGLFE